jgi:hypothetical protein
VISVTDPFGRILGLRDTPIPVCSASRNEVPVEAKMVPVSY